jgi:hypothetical protein
MLRAVEMGSRQSIGRQILALYNEFDREKVSLNSDFYLFKMFRKTWDISKKRKNIIRK